MKKKDGNFTVKCICDNGSDWFEEGKIYKVKDFYIRLKNGEKVGRRIANLNELNYAMAARFELAVENTTTITIYNTPGSPKVSAVMRRGDTVIKSAKAMYNPNDAQDGKAFSLDDGMELAVKRLFGWEEKAKPISVVKEVKRPAKISEWIKITKNHADDRFKKDEKYKIMALSEDGRGLYVSHPQGYQCETGYAYITGKDYVVLENHHQDAPQPVKFRKAKVGDRIKIVKKERHDPTVEIGDIFTVTSTGNQIAPCVRTEQHNVFYDEKEEYIILNR